jgi:hypothetical protein
MKQVTPELREFLHTHTEFIMCDLYEITLKSGLIFRYAEFDRDIKLPDGRFYSHKGPLFKRNRIKLSSGISVDKLTVTVYSNATDTVGGSPMIQVAHNGGFDEAELSLLRCIMAPPTVIEESLLMRLIGDGDGIDPQTGGLVVVGAVEMFTGYIDVDNGGGLEMKWTVKSGVQKLNVDYPLHKYYPTCPYSCYDDACGLNIDYYTNTGAITAVTSAIDFDTNIIGKPDGYYEQGGIEFTSGALSGVSAPVNTSYNANGRVVMLIPLDAAPAVGDAFNIYPGCDKTPATCKNKFSNFSHNRATPYIPLKETLM